MNNKFIDYADGYWVNEETKEVVRICTYGDNEEYFLSQLDVYENDFTDAFESNCHYTLVNELIDDENTFEFLVEKTKKML